MNACMYICMYKAATLSTELPHTVVKIIAVSLLCRNKGRPGSVGLQIFMPPTLKKWGGILVSACPYVCMYVCMYVFMFEISS